MRNMSKIQRNEQGLVAIIVVMVLMIVISLITLGFAGTIRKEQAQTLDYQLASQAFYAAEAGVNLAQSKGANLSGDKDSCGPDDNFSSDDYRLDDEVEITCLMVTRSGLESLKFDSVGTESKVTSIEPNGGTVGNLTIKWAPSGGGGISCDIADLPTVAEWGCPHGLLRVDIVPITNNMSQGQLLADQFTVFLKPHNSGSGSVVYSNNNASKGQIVNVNCSSECTTTIQGLNSAKYGLRMQSIYRQSNVSLSLGSGRLLLNAQALVDSTAVARGITHRVQARIPLAGAGSVPDYAISSGSALCKRYKVPQDNSPVTIDATGNADITAACSYPGF